MKPSDWNYLSIFKLLNKETKQAICIKLLQFISETPSLKESITELISQHSHMRYQTIAGFPVEKQAEYFAKTMSNFPYNFITEIFVDYHMEKQQQLIIDFLDYLNIPHEDGHFDNSDELQIFDSNTLRKAIEHLGNKYSEDDITFYLATLSANVGSPFINLIPLIKERLRLEEKDAQVEEDSAASDNSSQEENEDFTTLDNLLIRTIVDTAQDIEGALNNERLTDLISEIIQLNASRQRSYFHKGYMDGILGKEYQFSFQGENLSRRAWYLTGIIMGLLRRQADDHILELCNTHKRILLEIANHPGLDPHFKMIAPHLHTIFCRQGMISKSVSFISKKLLLLDPQFFVDVLEQGANYLREGKTGDADLLITLLYKEKDDIFRNYSFLKYFPIRVARKKGQVLQLRGDFAAAKEIYHGLLETLDVDDVKGKAYILSDIGLLEGGFKTISQLKIPSADKKEIFMASLIKGSSYFEQAISLSKETPNAHYCLGMLEYLDNNFVVATNLLNTALLGMCEDETSYHTAGILDTCRFLLAMSIYESFDDSQFNYATENLKIAFERGYKPPGNVIKSLLEITGTLLDREIVEYVGSYLYNVCGNKILQHIFPKHIEYCESIRCGIENLCLNKNTPTSQKWEYNRQLLRYYLSIGDIEKASGKLDFLEQLSIEGPEMEHFINLISDSQNYEPAWDRSDAKFSKIRFLEVSGKYKEAAVLLSEEFHRVCSDAQDYLQLQETSNILETIKSYGLDGDYISPLIERHKALETALKANIESDSSAPMVKPFSILFVGGNEMQKKYDEDVKVYLQERYSTLSVDFMHTNWESGWGEYLGKIKQRLSAQNIDLVILMRFIRTELGRRVRGLCNELKINWYTCTGHGKSSIEQSIIKAYEKFS